MLSTSALAQQPPTWSPAPFQSQAAQVAQGNQATQTNTVSSAPQLPVNKLRSNDPAANNDTTVLRWKVASSDSQAAPANKSYSQVMRPAENQDQRSASALSDVVTASHVIHQPQPTEPRSSFKLQPARISRASSTTDPIALGDPSVQLASHNAVARAPSSRDSSTTSGVWYDRDSKVASHGKNRIQRTGYQEDAESILPNEEPPAVNLPPQLNGTKPQDLPPASNPLDELEKTPKSTLREPLRETKEDPSRKNPSNRSLLNQDENNPFPQGSKKKNNDDSPSDTARTDEPEPIKPKADRDPAPKPPKRADRSVVDCDVIRQLAKTQQAIDDVNVNSSPNFVQGIKSKNQKTPNTKESFVQSAEVRTWYNYDSEIVAVGKLLDLQRGKVLIEAEDGTRVSYLMRKLSDADNAYVSQAWGFPISCTIEDRLFPSRDFVETTMTFKASGACHKPLYFEDVQLERYGHEWGPFAQPVISSAHFFGNIAVLPYKMGIHPPNECQYSLGYYRPGSCAPWTIGPVPISLRGALMQAKVVTGAALALP
jgi:hypothetical protein